MLGYNYIYIQLYNNIIIQCHDCTIILCYHNMPVVMATGTRIAISFRFVITTVTSWIFNLISQFRYIDVLYSRPLMISNAWLRSSCRCDDWYLYELWSDHKLWSYEVGMSCYSFSTYHTHHNEENKAPMSVENLFGLVIPWILTTNTEVTPAMVIQRSRLFRQISLSKSEPLL